MVAPVIPAALPPTVAGFIGPANPAAQASPPAAAAATVSPPQAAPVPPSLIDAPVAGSIPAPPTSPFLFGATETLEYKFALQDVPDAALVAWRKSADSHVRALAATVTQARAAYADAMSTGSRIFISTSVGNDYFPVLTLIGPDFDASQAPDVHTAYHGFGSVVADRYTDAGRMQLRMRDVQSAHPQVVFVLPECRNATPMSAPDTPWYQTDWSNAKDEVVTTTSALTAAGLSVPATRTVSFFSGGGRAFDYLQRAHPDGSALAADRLELIDCLYDDWTERIVAYASTANGLAVSRVRFIHGTNDLSRVAIVQKAFAPKFELVDVQLTGVQRNSDAQRPDGSPFRDSRGKPLAKFSDFTNYHLRARAEFLDSSRHP